MSRDLLLLLLGAPLIDVMAFDDDDDEGGDDDSDDDDDDGGDDTDDDDASGDTKKKDDGKKKDEDKPERKSKSSTPEALKRQVADLQKKLREKNTRIGNLTRERASLRRQSQGKDKKPTKSDDDSEVATLRQSVADLTDRLENISSENFIEKNVIRKLQNRITGGLDDDRAERKLNSAMRLVDAEEDFDEDGNFDVDGFLEKHPYMVAEAETKEDGGRNRLLGGSGNKSKSKKNYASDAVKKFNERRNGNRKAGTAKT